MPQETANLMGLTRIKVLAARGGISSISGKNGSLTMQISPAGSFDLEKLAEASRKFKGRVLFSAGASPYLVYKLPPGGGQGSEQGMIDDVLRFLSVLS